MGEDSKAFINEMQIDVSQKRVTKLIEAKKTIKEVIHYDPSEKSKYKTIVNMIDEVIVDELKVQANSIKQPTNKVEVITNPKLKEHMKLALNSNSLEYDNRLSSDEAVNHLADTFIQMKNIMDRVAIEDCWYSKEFFEEVENALITMAVIKAFGISKKSERYLGAIRKVVIELRTAESKG
jgi:aspartate carbamoyltransferase regulatory subunit